MTAVEVDVVDEPETASHREWAAISRRAPQLAVTGQRYLAQIGVSLQRRSVEAADNTLRLFVAFLTDEHPEVHTFAEVRRIHIEDFKTWLRQRRAPRGGTLTANTIRQRLGTLRAFFDRIIEWDWADTPARTPIFSNDLPIVDDPLPRFLDDPTFAKLMRATADAPALDRLVIELLAGTGMRVGELCGLSANSVTVISGAVWLRVPVGKLHNDRYVPLMPRMANLLDDWLTHNATSSDRLLHRAGKPLDRFTVARMLDRVTRRAGIGHVHPHQLRHTLATQAINRGMRLEAIATLLGHRSLRMTLVYARIANRTVAEEYHAASTKVEALYAADDDDIETPAMRQLRGELNRMLGNGYCTHPNEMGCSFEAVCEGCGFFTTTIDFKPTLQRQRDHAVDHDQPDRVEIYDRLLGTIHDPIEAIS